MEDKVYTPEVINQTPFPGEPQPFPITTTQPTGVYSPGKAPNKNFLKLQYADELLSTTLNTRSKKILGNFDLESKGGFQIGDFTEGVNGDIRITPAGITARNKAGITTLTVDGDTGDVALLGTVKASGFIVADENGLHSLNNFISDFAFSASQTSTTSSALFLTQINDLSFTFGLGRSAKVLMVLNTFGQNDNANAGGLAFVGIAVDNVRVSTLAPQHGTYLNGTVQNIAATVSVIATLGAGTHTIKGFLGRTASGNALVEADSSLMYMILGN